jgi:hypothetical protein
VLLLGAAIALFYYQPYGTLLALPLALICLMLIPGKQLEGTREKLRLSNMNELQHMGLLLRGEWRSIAEQPLSDAVARERWRVEREVLRWMSACDERLRKFPEIGGIFDARERKQDVIDDLDLTLSTLSRLRRLVSLSESLQLPI